MLFALSLFGLNAWALSDTFLNSEAEVKTNETSSLARAMKKHKKLVIYVLGSAPFLVGLFLTTGRNRKSTKIKKKNLNTRQKAILKQREKAGENVSSKTFQYLRFLNGQSVIVLNKKGQVEYATAGAFALFNVFDRQRKELLKRFYAVKENLSIESDLGIQLVEIEGAEYTLSRKLYKYQQDSYTIYSLSPHYTPEKNIVKVPTEEDRREIEALQTEGRAICDLENLVHEVLTKMSFVFQLTGTVVAVESNGKPLKTSLFDPVYLENGLSQVLYGINKVLGESKKSKKLTIRIQSDENKTLFKFFVHGFRMDRSMLTRSFSSEQGDSNFATYLGKVEKGLGRYQGRINIGVHNSEQNKLLGSQVTVSLNNHWSPEIRVTGA